MPFSRRIAPAATAALMAAALLAGCGTNNQQASPSSPGNDQSNPAAEGIKLPTTRPSKGEGSKPSPSASPTPTPVKVPGAYAGAGGPRPQNATPIASVHPATDTSPETAVIKTPSNNIGCDLSADFAGCGIETYQQSKPYGSDQIGAKWWVPLDGSGNEVEAKGDAPTYMDATVPPQLVEYGKVVYYNDYVCASEQNGLTCWNTSTGHGAFMNRDSTTLF